MSNLRKQLIRLAYQNPELQSDLLPLLRKASRDGFVVEKGDFGLTYQRSYQDNLTLYWPLENIGRRGRKVNVRDVSIQGDRIAWGHTFVDRVKKAANAAQANQMLDQLLNEIREKGEATGNHVWYDRTEQRKGVDKSLPTPTMYKIDDINGVDITVKLNAKPIKVFSKSHREDLEQSREVYSFEVHPRFRKKMNLLREELAAARGIHQVERILDANKIRYEYRRYMDPMWR